MAGDQRMYQLLSICRGRECNSKNTDKCFAYVVPVARPSLSMLNSYCMMPCIFD